MFLSFPSVKPFPSPKMSVAELSPSPYPISLVIPEESRVPLLSNPAGQNVYTNRHTNQLFDDAEGRVQTLRVGASNRYHGNDAERGIASEGNDQRYQIRDDAVHEDRAGQDDREGREEEEEEEGTKKKAFKDVRNALLRIALIPLIFWLAWNKLLLIRLADGYAHVLAAVHQSTQYTQYSAGPTDDGIKHAVIDAFTLSYPIAVFIVFLIDLVFVH